VHLAVCLKQVLDQEIPPRAFRVDRAARRPQVPGASLVMSIFDGNALETALKVREAAGGGIISALSIGAKSSEEMLRKALAVTADQAVLLSDPAFEELDSAGKARVLAAAIRKLTPAVDLVLCGRQAGDVENGQVGSMLAEELGWPCLTFVARIEVAPDGLRLYRQVEEGWEVYRAQPPLCCTVTNDGGNVLRLAKVRDVMQAHRKPLPTWGADDLGLGPDDLGGQRTRVSDLYIPERESRCEFVGGGTPAEKAEALARRLRELKVL
jgi:electron transfer flavoprotein beta subunit